MYLLTHVLLPLASLAVILCIWRLVYKRGWNKILPIFSRYVAFYFISTALLLGVFYCGLYPGRMQATICLLYSYGNYSVDIVTTIFLLVVLYELLIYARQNRAKIQVRVIAIIGVMALAAAIALAIVSTIASEAPNYCLRLAYFDDVFAKLTKLILLGLFTAMVALKIRFRLRWGRAVSLIVLGLVQFYLLDFAISVAVYNGHLRRVSDVLVQSSAFIWWVLWWFAVRKAPDTSVPAGAAAVSG